MPLTGIVLSVVLVKKSGIVTERFEAGKSDLKLVDVIDRKQDAPVTAGIIEIAKSEPCEFDYDNDCAVIYCTDGLFLLKEEEIETVVRPGDVVYIPKKKGLKVKWSSPSIGRGFYVTYPHWR
jgi:ethanolamine utilization protein EutQ (cupin superfamily)